MQGADPSALDPAHFAELVADLLPHHRPAVKELHLLLVRMGHPQTHAERAVWLEELGAWIHGDGDGLFGWGGLTSKGDEGRTNRLRAFLRALASVRGFRENFAALLTGLVRELRGTRLFADVGIPIEPAFWREAIDRISRRLLPTPPAPKSFADFLSRIFPSPEDAAWLERSPPELWLKLWNLLEGTKTPLSTAWVPLSGSMADAMRILSVRIAALGVAQDVRDRLPELSVGELPFLKLPTMCEAIQIGPPRLSTSNEGALATIEDCRAALRQLHAHVEEFGVSVDLVYRIELMTAQLARLEQFVAIIVPSSAEALAGNLGRLALALVRAQFQGRSVLELLRTSSHLLARKVVERSGKTGEHYITESRSEWRAMLVSAAGGGFLTAFTAIGKFFATGLGLPAFVTVLALALDYGGSFLLMGALGFTLATKQPSMTAAALAGALESEPGKARPLEHLVTLIAQISRSQLAAIVGNIGMVIPTALGVGVVWRLVTGHAFLAPAKAAHVLDSLHPWRSGTVAYAALTGVLLWMSSLAAGWLENWVTYRRLPDALAKHRRWRRLLGPERAARWAQAVGTGAASVGGSLSLGILLALVPFLGSGLGVDVRHVTLSTGSLVLAGEALPAAELLHANYLAAVAGIALIGALNFSVSFALALAVAVRARARWRVGSSQLVFELLRALLRRLVTRPLEFFFPGRAPGASGRG